MNGRVRILTTRNLGLAYPHPPARLALLGFRQDKTHIPELNKTPLSMVARLRIGK